MHRMDILKRFRSQEGITLLEVMVAVAVASLALVSLVSVVLSGLDMEHYSRKITEATVIADERMKEIERSGPPEPGIREWSVSESDPEGYFLRETVTETAINDVRYVELEVLWENRKRSVSLAAYMLNKGIRNGRESK